MHLDLNLTLPECEPLDNDFRYIRIGNKFGVIGRHSKRVLKTCNGRGHNEKVLFTWEEAFLLTSSLDTRLRERAFK